MFHPWRGRRDRRERPLRCSMRVEFPSGEHQDGRMARERPGEDLRSLDTEIHSIIFNTRDRGLRNTGQRRELVLTQALEHAPVRRNRLSGLGLGRHRLLEATRGYLRLRGRFPAVNGLLVRVQPKDPPTCPFNVKLTVPSLGLVRRRHVALGFQRG